MGDRPAFQAAGKAQIALVGWDKLALGGAPAQRVSRPTIRLEMVGRRTLRVLVPPYGGASAFGTISERGYVPRVEITDVGGTAIPLERQLTEPRAPSPTPERSSAKSDT